jgi:hypothetical protein
MTSLLAERAWLLRELIRTSGCSEAEVLESLALFRTAGIEMPVVNRQVGQLLQIRFGLEEQLRDCKEELQEYKRRVAEIKRILTALPGGLTT